MRVDSIRRSGVKIEAKNWRNENNLNSATIVSTLNFSSIPISKFDAVSAGPCGLPCLERMNRWRHAGGVGDFVTGTAVRSSGPEAHRDGARSFASGRGLRAVLPNRAPRYCPAYRHLVRDHHGNSGAEGNRSRSGTPERNPWMGEVRNHSVNSNRPGITWSQPRSVFARSEYRRTDDQTRRKVGHGTRLERT